MRCNCEEISCCSSMSGGQHNNRRMHGPTLGFENHIHARRQNFHCICNKKLTHKVDNGDAEKKYENVLGICSILCKHCPASTNLCGSRLAVVFVGALPQSLAWCRCRSNNAGWLEVGNQNLGCRRWRSRGNVRKWRGAWIDRRQTFRNCFEVFRVECCATWHRRRKARKEQ